MHKIPSWMRKVIFYVITATVIPIIVVIGCVAIILRVFAYEMGNMINDYITEDKE